MSWSDFLNFERTNKELRWLAMNKPPSQSDDDADRNSCEAVLEHLNTNTMVRLSKSIEFTKEAVAKVLSEQTNMALPDIELLKELD